MLKLDNCCQYQNDSKLKNQEVKSKAKINPKEECLYHKNSYIYFFRKTFKSKTIKNSYYIEI